MSEEGRKQEASFHDSLHTYFTKTVNFIDENLRIVQNLVYCTAIFGCLIALRSLRAFSKFKTIEDIPTEFVMKGMKLRGIVHSLHSVNIKQFPLKSRSHTDGKFLRKNLAFSSNIGTLLEGHATLKSEEKLISTPIYALINHLPIFSFKQEDGDGLLIRLTSIQTYEEGLREAEKDLLNQKIWFRILKYDEDKTCLDCIIRSPHTYFGTYNRNLVKKGLAYVEPFDQSLKKNKIYTKFYTKLINDQAKSETKRYSLWKKLRSYVLR